MRRNGLMYAGIAILVASPILGIVGTLWFIYGGFSALETAEGAGLGPVGSAIRNALICSLAGIGGAVVGLVIIVRGRRTNKQT